MEEYITHADAIQPGMTMPVSDSVKSITFNGERKPVPHYFVIHWKDADSAIRHALARVDATPLAYKVFYGLANDLVYPFGNVVLYSPYHLAKRYEVTKDSMYIAIAHIRRADLARRIRKGLLRLNPYLVWAGKIPNYYFAAKAWDGGVDTLQPYEMREELV
jgi:hypothetical protein